MATLNDEQEFYLQKILKTIQEKGQALFAIISPGGTGKSFFIKRFEALHEKGNNLEILTPTNLTAHALDAQTIFKFCNWRSKKISWKKYDHDPNLQIVIVYEVGCMNAHILEGLNAVLKRKKQNDLPFGGCSVILVGDFFQLSTIDDKNKKSNKRESLQLFEAPSWNLFELIEFKTNYRQSSDAHHQERLGRWRVGRVNQKDLKYLREHTISKRTTDYGLVASKMAEWCRVEDGLQSFIVTPNATSVTTLNNLVCEQLGFTKKVNFLLKDDTPLESGNTFYVGKNARVIVSSKFEVTEKSSSRTAIPINVHNGEIGTVIAYKVANEPSDWIEVKFPRTGRSVIITRGKRQQEYVFNMNNAYALTIPEVQGKTLKNVILDTTIKHAPTDTSESMIPGGFYTAASMVSEGANFHITELCHVENVEQLKRLILPRQDAITALAAKREN